MKILIAYVPVLYRGYIDFFLRHRDATKLLLFGSRSLSRFEWLKKDLRALDPEIVATAIRSLDIFPEVGFLEDVPLSELQQAKFLVMPDETECHLVAESDLKGLPIKFDSVKLRYDKKKTESTDDVSAVDIHFGRALSLMGMANDLKQQSPDWWIQVGALIVRGGEILLSGWNEHKPSERETLFMGDPRSNYNRGVNIELSLADHAEKVLIGEAARRGIALLDTDLFVTTFPCPPCARLVARAGVRRLFFQSGYALLDGDSVLKKEGIEVFRVKS